MYLERRKILATFAIFAVLLTLTVQANAVYMPSVSHQGTEVGSGSWIGTLSDASAATSIPQMGYSYHDIVWYWIDLNRFDKIELTLLMDTTLDADLGLWHLSGEGHIEKSTNYGKGITENVGLWNQYGSEWQIFVGCWSGSGDYTLAVEVERVKNITGSGTYTGTSVNDGNWLHWVDDYKVELKEGDYAKFTLTPPATADFSMEVSCEDYWKGTAGHETHLWRHYMGVGEEETVQITGSNVPHDGTYYITVWSVSGSGSYTLKSVIDRTPPVISNVARNPQQPQPSDTVTVTANVTDPDSGVKTTTLRYSKDGGTTWSDVAMTVGTGSIYTGTIPAQPDGTAVQYKIKAEDNAGFSGESAVASYTSKTLIFGMEPLMFYALVGGLVVIVVVVVVLLVVRKPKAVPPPTPTSPPAPAYAPPPAPAAPPTAFCPNCGTPISPGTVFCPKCGRRIQ
jgi:hypothetical protein